MHQTYVEALMPVFCTTYQVRRKLSSDQIDFPAQGTMVGSVKRASLGLIAKLVHYLSPLLLGELSQAEVGA